ncbi:bifunctional diguanylate cyclase/phosphodiesterase [Ferrimonas pelagia]|uniref:LapD/MoxY N-terminal periplasmic domain-containing protein n=1 Tax=Ferrimonas pelagia TaxID=1177826 RepID=A0ABP9F870_9GAMM
MTLYRQLVLLFLLCISIISLVNLSIAIGSQQNTVAQNQTLHLNSSLNNLSMAIRPLLLDEDQATLNVTLSAFFDINQFNNIRLDGPEGQALWQKEQNLIKGSVPAWFAGLAWFEAPQGEVTIEAGWRQLGSLHMQIDPSLAYQQLWDAAGELVMMSIGLTVLCCLALFLVLRQLVFPLKALQSASQTLITKREFKPINIQARTLEFREVQSAFNTLGQHFELFFKEQAEEAKKLRGRLYLDPLSGLGNRQLLAADIEHWREQKTNGLMVLIQLPALADILDERGASYYQSFTQNLQQQLDVEVQPCAAFGLYRLQNHELALLVQDVDKQKLLSLLNTIKQVSEGILVDPLGISVQQSRITGLYSEHPEEIGEMLTLLDNHQQEEREPNSASLHQHNPNTEGVRGRQQWVEFVEQAIAHQAIEFRQQAVLDTQGNALHFEVFSSIVTPTENCPASSFLPFLELQEKTTQFDRHVIEQMFLKLDLHNKRTLAVNLSASSLLDIGFMRWLGRILKRYPQYRHRLYLEISEVLIYQHTDSAAQICESINQAGYAFGIDHFGRNLNRVDYLTQIPRPAYVKLDYLYSQGLDDTQGRDLLTALCRTAHKLNILTIATRVENSDQLALYQELHVDAVQGYISQNWEEVQQL